MGRLGIFLTFMFALLWPVVGWGNINNPYPDHESEEAIYYSSFRERPKHFDPAISYSTDESRFIDQIYEPVVQYHYLKRPYELIPLSASQMPESRYVDREGKVLSGDPDASLVFKTIWTVKIKPGIRFQEHPCFARDSRGQHLYHQVTEEDMTGIQTLFDFSETGSRELAAEDYLTQIKRMADPRTRCPIFTSVVAKYIVGMSDYALQLQEAISQERQQRSKKARDAGQLLYNAEVDEKKHPIIIDYNSLSCPGLRILNDTTFEIEIQGKYPQFIYWLAMHFFCPMPWEAITFYEQAPMKARNITLDWYPVGTGAYRLNKIDPNTRIELVANENYRSESYPDSGELEDHARGYLKDVGQLLPLIPKAVYSLEVEATPAWQKFKQGYYDVSGIASDNFFEVMDFSTGSGHLGPSLRERNIELVKSVDTTTSYLGFNMMDSVVGGLDEKNRNLRQAVSIAINREQLIQIFRKGMGIPAQGPIPPGIFGHLEGEEGVNSYTYDWDDGAKKPVRKSLDEARKLLAKAGYPNGIHAGTGEPLILFYDTVTSPGSATYKAWLKKQFSVLGVELQIRETDYNRFREKMMNGGYQIFSWGWQADYPDPENFLFLFYGPNGRTRYKGENTANYYNEAYDALFEQMATMTNTPERLALIQEMLAILRHDAPWEFGFYPESYTLYHSWTGNIKPNKMANNQLKYRRIDPSIRESYRKQENAPRMGVALGLVLIVAGFFVVMRRRTTGGGSL